MPSGRVGGEGDSVEVAVGGSERAEEERLRVAEELRVTGGELGVAVKGRLVAK